jgi:hypothetical protein
MYIGIVSQFPCITYGFMKDAASTSDIKSIEVCEGRGSCIILYMACFLDLPNLMKSDNYSNCPPLDLLMLNKAKDGFIKLH